MHSRSIGLENSIHCTIFINCIEERALLIVFLLIEKDVTFCVLKPNICKILVWSKSHMTQIAYGLLHSIFERSDQDMTL